MKNWLLFAVCLGYIGTYAKEPAVPAVRLTVDLSDGSRLVGTSQTSSLPVETEYASLTLPITTLRQLELSSGTNQATIRLNNGDSLRGKLLVNSLQLETLFGKVSLDVALVKKVVFASMVGGALPVGEGPLEFGGLKWTPQRRDFEIQGDRLVALARAREGFDYGHGGHGRAAVLVSNVGNPDWRDYALEFDLGVTGVDGNFNPHGLPENFRRAGFMFHVVSCPESWNTPASSCYSMEIDSSGTWTLGRTYNFHLTPDRGYGPSQHDGSQTLAKGAGLKMDADKGNRLKIEVVGQQIRVWFDEEKLVDLTDEDMGKTVKGTCLDHGGIGLFWQWECVGWVKKFSAHKL